jgi:hypothetical protein
MSIPHARKGRHAAPARPTGRRLAVVAAALAAGAVPLACAGTADAAATAAPQGMLPTLGLPDLPLPLGLPDSVGSLAGGLPLAQDLPVNDLVDGITPPLSEVVQVGSLGLLPEPAQAAPMVRSADFVQQPDTLAQNAENMALSAGSLATSADRALTDGAQASVERLTSALPLGNLVPALASASGGPLQLAPHVLTNGALGTLTAGIAPQTTELTGGIIGQAEPLVSQLHQSGVPTVGDLTGGLSSTQLPVVGTVGSITQTLPVTSLLGGDSPVTGALQNLNGL